MDDRACSSVIRGHGSCFLSDLPGSEMASYEAAGLSAEEVKFGVNACY